MVATKEQERKALEKIRKIVEELGEDSYLSIAFDGCFEDAEENIENDFACSWKQRAQSAAATAARLEQENRDMRDTLKSVQESSEKAIADVERQLAELKKKVVSQADIAECVCLAHEEWLAQEDSRRADADLIVELAENPESDDFKGAVSSHRSHTLRAKQIAELIERLRKASI